MQVITKHFPQMPEKKHKIGSQMFTVDSTLTINRYLPWWLQVFLARNGAFLDRLAKVVLDSNL